ncbi:MAG: cohesin domain-containing protein, partial [bacterium]|nr:cohesin domain-containing protein [bacterium]
ASAFALTGLPQWVEKGQIFEVIVSLKDGQNVRGYSFDMLFDAATVTPALDGDASRLTSYLGNVETFAMLKEFNPGQVSAVNIHQGRPEGASGSGEVAVFRFQAVADGRPGISLENGIVIDPNDQVSAIGLGQVNGQQISRADFALDGTVDLADYSLLEEAMGSSQTRFDLTGDGSVDGADRESFVAAFTGTAVSTGTATGELSVNLVGDMVKPNTLAGIEVRLTGVPSLKAFEFELTYDANRFEYASIDVEATQFTSGEAFTVREAGEGRLLVMNALGLDRQVGEDNLLARLNFQVKGEFDQATPFTLASGILVDGRDLLSPIANLGHLEVVTAPTTFSLHQNFPNPFNPETTIAYDLADNVAVNLSIYNALGQQIATLVNGAQTAGRYQIVWNGTDNGGRKVSSGIYFYKLNAGSFQATQRLMLLK